MLEASYFDNSEELVRVGRQLDSCVWIMDYELLSLWYRRFLILEPGLLVLHL